MCMRIHFITEFRSVSDLVGHYQAKQAEARNPTKKKSVGKPSTTDNRENAFSVSSMCSYNYRTSITVLIYS